MKASKRILYYSLLITTVTSSVGNLAEGAIRFTPSSVVFHPPAAVEQTSIDLNGDSLPDFMLRNSRFDVCACLPGDPPPPYWDLSIDDDTGATNQMHVVDAFGHQLFPPQSLAANSAIDGAKPYGATDGDGLFYVVLNTGQVRGNFQPAAAPQFVGVKFNLAGSIRYGWIGFDVPLNVFDGVRLLGYAYDDSGAAILAGQTVAEPTTSLLIIISLTVVCSARRATNRR